MESQIFKLKNNIEVFYRHNAKTPRIALCFNFSVNKAEKNPCAAALMARLFMQGTKNRTAEQIANELEAYAIEFSAILKSDYLQFKFVCLNEDFSKALELMSDIIKNSTFEEFDKELLKMKGEIVAELDSPRTKVSDAYERTMFKNHPYGTTYTLMLKNADSVTKQDVLDVYEEIMNNSRKVIALVGEIPFEEAKEQLDNAFCDISNDKDIKDLPAVKALNGANNTEIIKPDANQAHILKGWLVPSYTSEDYAPLLLLNIILGASGLSSRLFLELRDKKGLAYVVRSSYEALSLCGNFSIYIATEPKNIEVSMAGFKEEIDKIKTVKVSDEELENAKNNLIGKWAFTRETNFQQACLYAHSGVLGLGFDFYDRAKELVLKVTPDQIKSCAEKYFNDNYVTAVLKP